jgi:hypothetical protein
VSVKIRVRATSETVVGDVEVQHQRHRTRHVRKVDIQLYIPTMSTLFLVTCTVESLLSSLRFLFLFFYFYYESRKPEIKTRLIYEDR